MRREPKLFIEVFFERDMNRDGNLDEHGFSASMMSLMQQQPDFNISKEESKDIFKLCCAGRMFRYADFMAEIDEATLAVVKEMIPNYTMQESAAFDVSIGPSDALGLSLDASKKDLPLPDRAALFSAIEKINSFLMKQNVTLSVLFNVIDTNADQSLSKGEFNQKMKALHLGLKDDEIDALFKKLDINGDGSITYEEFMSSFASVNARQII